MSTVVQPLPERNRSIDIWRLVCAVSALFAHSWFLYDVNQGLYYSLFYVILGRYVVQFFVCVSGYFYFKALLHGRDTFRKQFPRLLKIYLLWTLVYYSASFVLSVVVNHVPLSRFLIDRVVFFFTEGSYPHLWNFPATLYPLLLVEVVHRLWGERGIRVLAWAGIPLYFIGSLGSAYYPFSQHIPVLSVLYGWTGFPVFRNIVMIGLPSFTLGYLLNHWERRLARFPNRALLAALGLCVALYAVEAVVTVFHLEGIDRPQAPLMAYPLVGVLFVTLLRYPLPRLAAFSEMARRQANFVYFIHPLLLAVLNFLTGVLSVQLPTVVTTTSVLGLSLLAGWWLIRVNRPWSDMLLGLPASRTRAPAGGSVGPKA